MVKGYLFCIVFLYVSILFSQHKYSQDIFQPPMDLPIELSGSFSEIRTINFHSGIDIRVINRPHRRVYSIEGGYISRIKTEPSGYGKALYITHPQGYTSVYGHLDYFNEKTSELIKNIQYQRQEFSVDVYFPSDSLPVEKGEFIGIAGNTGSSFGAHLHFEIRDAETQEIIDPLLFGIKVLDTCHPLFHDVKIYPHGNSYVNNKNDAFIYPVKAAGGNRYVISATPVVTGAVSFGFNVSDRQNLTNPNRLGLKSMSVYIDDSLFVFIHFAKLSFNVLRHQLAYIDYPEREKSKKCFHRTWKKSGNKLPVYKFIRDDGIFYISENKLYTIRCLIKDIGGNTAELVFNLQGHKKEDLDLSLKCDSGSFLFRCDTINIWNGEYSSVIIDTNVLFSDYCFMFEEKQTSFSEYAPQFTVFCDEAATGFYMLKIKPYIMPEDIRGLTIAQVGAKGKLRGVPTVFSDDRFEGVVRSFGTFVLVRDTIPPLIKSNRIPSSGDVSNLKKLSFIVTDDICGIDTYNAYIDENWILLEYDLKNDEMFYIIDDMFPKENAILKIIVTDKCGNEAVWEKALHR